MNRIFFCLVTLLFTFSSSSAEEKKSKTVSVLTIGNSFAENALTYLPAIAIDAGHRLVEGRANMGGCSLERHWGYVAAFQKNPNGKYATPYGGGKLSLDGMLKNREWDFITLQQRSMLSHDPATYEPFGKNLYHYIKERRPDSKVMVHQTWAYRVDDPRFVPANEGNEPHTQREMYEQVRKAYHAFADEFDLGILPGGDAMFLADIDPETGYRPDQNFDFENAVPPALPDETYSLHTGWSWKKNDAGEPFLKLDGHHAGIAGKFLLGCVWFEVLFEESVLGNSFVPEKLDPDYAAFLRKKAHEAVRNLKMEKTVTEEIRKEF